MAPDIPIELRYEYLKKLMEALVEKESGEKMINFDGWLEEQLEIVAKNVAGKSYERLTDDDIQSARRDRGGEDEGSMGGGGVA